jgi:hypothetical protein
VYRLLNSEHSGRLRFLRQQCSARIAFGLLGCAAFQIVIDELSFVCLIGGNLGCAGANGRGSCAVRAVLGVGCFGQQDGGADYDHEAYPIAPQGFFPAPDGHFSFPKNFVRQQSHDLNCYAINGP